MKRIIALLLFLCFNHNTRSSSFETDIRPILSKYCYQCHSSKAEKIKGDVVLDSKDGFNKVIDRTDLRKSSLLEVIVSGDMPPKEKMNSEDKNIIVSWVRQGALLPDTLSISSSKWGNKVSTHWSFKDLANIQVPQNNEKNPIDNFVIEKLKAIDLKLSPETNKRELVRRLYFDMTGLPPKYDTVLAFENGSKSWEQLVDEVLSSTAYGERWARHWLDVARYSDYKGGANNDRSDPRYPYAWTYRDYVINSLNQDKPFDLFIKEQLAADLLPENIRSKDALNALAFITIGRRDNNINDVIDDRIDVVTKGFLGLTVTCARCHDHKFDPITQIDYYALHGIFRSVSEPNDITGLPITNDRSNVAYANKRNSLLADIQTYKTNSLAKWVSHFQNGSSAYIVHTHNFYNEVPRSDRNQYVRTNSVLKVTQLVNDMLNRWNREMNSRDIFWTPYQELSKTKPTEWPMAFKKMIATPDKFDAYVVKAIQAQRPKNIREVVTLYAQLFSVTMSNVSSGRPPGGLLHNKAYAILTKKNGPCDLGDLESFYRILNNRERTQYENGLRTVTAKFIDHEWENDLTPSRAMVILEDKPITSKVFLLGDSRKLGDMAPRGFIKFLDEDYKPFNNKDSGRLELAESIIESPISARTIVNRIWMHHFGHGFVDTPDDLGVQANDPTNLELLEFLSQYLRSNDWSLKRLHKLILMSKTYKQDSKPDGRAETLDPGNQLLHRQNIRRLEFEGIRDSIFMFANRGEFTKTHGGPVDLFRAPYPNTKTIYGIVDRRRLPETLANFDVANPNLPTGKRFDTTVPQQSLFFLNSDMILVKVREIAKVANNNPTNLYHIIYQRNPSDTELKMIDEFLNNAKAEKLTPFEQLTQVLVLSSEAMYIR